MANRPLSPHIGIYRFAYTMALSIVHRAAGLALSTGLVVLVFWLFALARGEAQHRRFAGVVAAWPMRLVLAVGLVAFVYHFANGIRHLCWDAGWGLEKAQARRSAVIVVTAVLLLSTVLLYVFFLRASP
jgi:succinate dehydrogenase / fumarate reductase, cytochrome b subunit